MTLKLYCILAEEAVRSAGGNRGKMIAQAGHAFLHTYWDAEDNFPEDASAYRASANAVKVTLVAPTETLLILREAYAATCGTSLVRDRALTVFPEPLITALGLGPLDLGSLRLGEGQDQLQLRVFI